MAARTYLPALFGVCLLRKASIPSRKCSRSLADKGYRGHNAPPDYKFRVFLSGQKRGVTPTIKRQLRRRSAVEPVIGHPRRRRLQLPTPPPLLNFLCAKS
jgi:hypothetical protein